MTAETPKRQSSSTTAVPDLNLWSRTRRRCRFGVWCLVAIWSFPFGTSLNAAEPTAEQVEFFENHIRPLFADNCYPCHSEGKKIKGGLRLDSRAKLMEGGDSGPAIVPGDPEASRLIKAVRYQDKDLQMPPKDKKLSAVQIAALEAWVKMGAPMPKATVAKSQPSDFEVARARHWAFQPVRKPEPPKVKNSRWVQTPVDNFALAKLEQKHLTPAPRADRRTLLRRVYYDLVGLPPTMAEVEAFEHDRRPDAYSQVVDRLLASPHYGERWGRYWLDVARYADTKGYLAGGEERRYAFSYTYRDYVVRAYNDDKPYDQFLIEQIAADRLPLGENKAALAAEGFLTLGRRFLNNQNDIIDDRIDVITRGTLGLTVACARCHDHKFDPISTRDYYALHGVLASSEEPAELPLLQPIADTPAYEDYLQAKAGIEKEIAAFEEQEIARFQADLRQNVGDYLLAAHDVTGLADPSKFDDFAGERKVLPVVLHRWIADLKQRAAQPDPVFGPWFELAKLDGPGFATNTAPVLTRLKTDPAGVNPVVAQALSERAPDSLKQVAAAYTKLFQHIDREWKTNLTTAAAEKKTAPTTLSDPPHEALRQLLYADNAPPHLPEAEVRKVHARRLREGAAPLRNKIEALSWTQPGVPLRAMALVDRPQPHDSPVFLRGNPGNPGVKVPRRFLEVLSLRPSAPFTNGSGRLELARAIASPGNPLTARVYVNRVWLHHFGRGLVGTPGDFGVRTAAPVQRELLDYLAASFVENGWSAKKLHRLIVLSATYQQSSDANPRCVAADPENHLLHHMNRQRLDFEALRDTLLADSGRLDLTVGGLPVDIVAEPFSPRRTVYGLIDRQNLPGLFRTFDFANPDTSSQGRFHTTVPQQALFMLNSPFVVEQARALVQRDEVRRAKNRAEAIDALYRLTLQRPAERGEIRLAEKYLAAQPSADTALSPLAKYAQVLLLSNELTFVD